MHESFHPSPLFQANHPVAQTRELHCASSGEVSSTSVKVIKEDMATDQPINHLSLWLSFQLFLDCIKLKVKIIITPTFFFQTDSLQCLNITKMFRIPWILITENKRLEPEFQHRGNVTRSPHWANRTGHLSLLVKGQAVWANYFLSCVLLMGLLQE